jgi:protocatechuate 3,4-dioxygenase beta subunit
MKNTGHDSTRRRFIQSSVTLAASLQLSAVARAANKIIPGADVCQLLPEQEVGPFYVADEILRSDIVEEKPGIPLTLRILVLDSRSCKPLPNAAIDLWHCDAGGLYSGFTKSNPGGPGGGLDFGGPDGRPPGPPLDGPPDGGFRGGPGGGPPAMKPTDKLTFLRGIQITDADGTVNFRTIFPGYYQGRTNHIHFKVRVGGGESGRTYAAGHTSHVGQIFFPEDVAAELMNHEPYSLHRIHRVSQTEDGIFRSQHGDLMLASLKKIQAASAGSGYSASISVGVDPTATPAPVQMGFGGPPRG